MKSNEYIKQSLVDVVINIFRSQIEKNDYSQWVYEYEEKQVR